MQRLVKMEHLAILSKERKLLAKIISGEKTIESRWYKFKRTPYQNISAEEVIYFKESGMPVTARAKVNKVLFFDDLNPEKVTQILEEYGTQIGIPVSYASNLIGKNFCTLIFLEDVEQIEPFDIDKKGYGLMSAWITVENIDALERRRYK